VIGLSGTGSSKKKFRIAWRSCGPLLLRAGQPKLTLVVRNAALDFEATLDVEGMSADQLDALDRAERRLRALTRDELAALDPDLWDP